MKLFNWLDKVPEDFEVKFDERQRMIRGRVGMVMFYVLAAALTINSLVVAGGRPWLDPPFDSLTIVYACLVLNNCVLSLLGAAYFPRCEAGDTQSCLLSQ